MYTMCVGVGPFSIHLLCGPGGLYMYYIKQHVYIFIPIYISRTCCAALGMAGYI